MGNHLKGEPPEGGQAGECMEWTDANLLISLCTSIYVQKDKAVIQICFYVPEQNGWMLLVCAFHLVYDQLLCYDR